MACYEFALVTHAILCVHIQCSVARVKPLLCVYSS